MRTTVIIGITLGLVLPFYAGAQGIRSVTQSSADSGGSISDGVTTSGDASASIYVRNVVGSQGTTTRASVQLTTGPAVGGTKGEGARVGEASSEGKGKTQIKIATSSVGTQIQVVVAATSSERASRKSFLSFDPFRALFRNFFSLFNFF